MHPVEQTTWRILSQLITRLDPARAGVCIDAGVGNQDYYFEWFANYGYRTIAIEPVPNEEVRKLCRAHGVQLIEAALSNHVATAWLKIESDLRTLIPNFGGISFVDGKPTNTILLDVMITEPVTCLKLDIEGAEWLALQRLPHCQYLPEVISFEFGGMFPKHTGRGGWTEAAVANTHKCLNLLSELGYSSSVLIGEDRAGLSVKPFTTHRKLFTRNLVWGNIVTTRAAVEREDWYRMAQAELRFSP